MGKKGLKAQKEENRDKKDSENRGNSQKSNVEKGLRKILR